MSTRPGRVLRTVIPTTAAVALVSRHTAHLYPRSEEEETC
jgi:hypothetical protein